MKERHTSVLVSYRASNRGTGLPGLPPLSPSPAAARAELSSGSRHQSRADSGCHALIPAEL